MNVISRMKCLLGAVAVGLCLDVPNGTGSGCLFKNVACNSIEGASRFEVRTLKFCGFLVLVDTCYGELHARFWVLGAF